MAGTIKGKVTGASDDAPLIGANVYLEGTTMGAATDDEGMYEIDAADGTYTLVCEYVGYATQKVEVTVDGTVEVNFQLVEYLFSKTISVIADRAKERETPVAFTNVAKAKIEEQLGSRDIPMVMNTTPSVYSTMQGGGSGDARINVRGFNQRNVAIMINGVPVNDMENGWVYWSNWDGVGDATSSIQMQRGLSAVNLATPSIGGTMNIITDPTALNSGFRLKQEYGSGTMLKTTFTANTGLIDDKYAISATVVRKIGDGVIDKTWTDAWAYYFGASYNVNDNNRLEFYALGAPQRHGQNLYKQNIAAYSKSFAKDLGYSQEALDAFEEKGRLWNQNWGPVSSSYTGKQAVEGNTFDRYDKNFINERENFFHKPQVNLNWYSTLSDNMSFTNVLYYSGGTGGGTGTYGKFQPDFSRNPWVWDWDKIIAKQQGDTAQTVIRNSRNNQWTIGNIAKLYWKANDNLSTMFGVDWRTAEIEHYREIRDMLGASVFIDTRNEFDTTPASQEKRLGDKVNYFNTNTVDWIGGFAQAEYTLDELTAYGTVGYSSIKYGFTDHFKKGDDGNELSLQSDNISSFQVKGGAMYRINDDMEVYGNAGYVEKVPIFDAVIDDRNGVFADNPANETFLSFEGGLNYRGLDGMLSSKLSFYYTKWQDRTMTRGIEITQGVFDILFISGLDQLHTGFEFEAAFQPMPMFRLDLAGSIGSWNTLNDVSGSYRTVESGTTVTKNYQLAVKDLKIGDAPQTQVAVAATVFPIQGMSIQGVLKYYDQFYADWDPTSRIVFDGDTPDRGQSWLTPSYNLVDMHASYQLPFDLNGVQFKLSAHIFNLLDTEYISDATDNSRFNAYRGDGKNHKADDAEVFFGIPRTFNLGLSITY
ncbi:MAG TPA: TonB-dependent receptor [Caldithrix abyssi]|uniref:TonB-dependent receptor n=1 Tax=Caldithrix abyssi TaxID=187145 RepID=A0A7V1LKI5_CALAY|nr:TonB-dependent receptor [Caldithrix abyssi]